MNKFLRILGCFFIIFSIYLSWQRVDPSRVSFDIDTTLYQGNSKEKSKYPTSIVIENVGIRLPIIPTQIENKKWQVTDRGVSYLVSTPVPGDAGNSVLYGHNWNNLLGPLTKVVPGEKLRISFSDGSQREFLVEYTTVVTPDKTYVLGNTNDHRLTLYTCTGFLDRKRFVVTASPIDIAI